MATIKETQKIGNQKINEVKMPLVKGIVVFTLAIVIVWFLIPVFTSVVWAEDDLKSKVRIDVLVEEDQETKNVSMSQSVAIFVSPIEPELLPKSEAADIDYEELISQMVANQDSIIGFTVRILHDDRTYFVSKDTTKKSDAWMDNYRYWEPNRKVFLYPEDWTEPELGDDKSDLFQELEDELL